MEVLVSEKKGFQIRIRYVMLPLLFAIIIFVSYLLHYVGAFKPVVIEEKTAGPFAMIFKTHIGPYHKIVADIEDVETWAKAQGLDCHLTFGQYLDNPADTEESRLRSHGGCLLPALPSLTLPEGFSSQTVPENHYVTAIFEGSPGIGPMKVYPKVQDYIEEKRLKQDGAIIEVYNVHSQESMTTTYYFPVK
jgi:effector-binding domain-containing protein